MTIMSTLYQHFKNYTADADIIIEFNTLCQILFTEKNCYHVFFYGHVKSTCVIWNVYRKNIW
jgi:hypothetical protein